MNATCPAGISQPQRVSDLGRLLDSEITARWTPRLPGVVHPPAWRLPLCMAPPPAWRLLLCMAPPSAWRLLLYKAPCSLARALCKSALITGACSLQSALAPGACSLQGALTSPCARGHFIRHTGLRVPSQPKANFLKGVAFPKKRCILPHLAHASDLSQPQARRRALRVPLGSTRPTTRAARLVRHRRHALRVPFGTKDQATHEHTTDSALSASCSASTSRPLQFVLSTVGIGPHSHLAECDETSTDGRPGRPESPPKSTARYDSYFQ